jgi:hypothetical protein
VLLGESILSYRVFRPFEAVVPITDKGEMLDAAAAANRGYEGLHGWMKKAERVWNADRPSPISFVQQLDYYGKLASQFPLAPLRVVYAASGTNAAACVVRSTTNVIDNSLYWASMQDEQEAQFLTAVFNGETARSRGARHFHKVMFNLPIPRFDVANPHHSAIAEAAREAETIATAAPLPENIKFQRARGLIREALAEAGVAQRIDALVARLLDGG